MDEPNRKTRRITAVERSLTTKIRDLQLPFLIILLDFLRYYQTVGTENQIGYNPLHRGSREHRHLLRFHLPPYEWKTSTFYSRSKKVALIALDAKEQDQIEQSIALVCSRITKLGGGEEEAATTPAKTNNDNATAAVNDNMPSTPTTTSTPTPRTPTPRTPTPAGTPNRPPRTPARITDNNSVVTFNPTVFVNNSMLKGPIVLELNDDETVYVKFPPAIAGLKPKFRFSEDGCSIGYYAKRIALEYRPTTLLSDHHHCADGTKWHNMVDVEMKRQLGIQPNGQYPPLPSDDDFELYWLATVSSPVEKQFYKPGTSTLIKADKPKMGSNGKQIWFSFFLKKITTSVHTDVDDVDAVDQTTADLATKLGIGCKFLEDCFISLNCCYDLSCCLLLLSHIL
jgi:hypothetical protein